MFFPLTKHQPPYKCRGAKRPPIKKFVDGFHPAIHRSLQDARTSKDLIVSGHCPYPNIIKKRRLCWLNLAPACQLGQNHEHEKSRHVHCLKEVHEREVSKMPGGIDAKMRAR